MTRVDFETQVYGNTAQELEEAALTEAHKFFGSKADVLVVEEFTAKENIQKLLAQPEDGDHADYMAEITVKNYRAF